MLFPNQYPGHVCFKYILDERDGPFRDRTTMSKAAEGQELDRWCEQRLLGGSPVTGLSEPLAACTGVLMLAIFLMPNSKEKKLPSLFLATKASFVLLGAGTCIFHGMSHSYARDVLHVNLDLFDWLPLVLVASSLVLLYAHDAAMRGSRFQLWWYVAVGVWTLALIVCMDSSTYATLDDRGIGWGYIQNGLLLAPLFGVLAYFTWTSLRWRALHLWILLVVGAALWAANVGACERGVYALAPLHALYHLVMAVAMVHAACLGLLLLLGVGGRGWMLAEDDSRLWVFSRFAPLKVAAVDKREKGEGVSDEASWWLMK